MASLPYTEADKKVAVPDMKREDEVGKPSFNIDVEDATDEKKTTDVKHSLQVPQAYNFHGLKLLPYSHPRVQAIMLGCVLFLTVGMYNVITFLGGAGQETTYLSDIANISLYTVFTVFCLISPACLNYFGLRASLCFGGFGYAAYAASLWYVISFPTKAYLVLTIKQGATTALATPAS